MCKALGMNAVCIYIFWNIHEQTEGNFDFTGNNDVAEFCRLAQKNGMYVIVRPGPYVCAEWEMGGLPWWLLKKKDIRLREQDPYFMERVKIFEQKVGEQLAPLTIQNGGPIIMVQVENEYGSYGEDKAYISEIRDIVREAFTPLPSGGAGGGLFFQCDWASNFTKNGLDDLVWTMNFGTGANIDKQFDRLKQLRPNAPLMCSEFWSGWFDKWGARHETRPAKDMVEGMDEMLSKNISFSLYMTHGGTSFGHWAGANSPGFAPDVTSYDYDAPINEYGQPTPKYYKLREMMQKYAEKNTPPRGSRKGVLPAVPKPAAPIITIPKFSLEKVMRISDYQTAQRQSRDVLTMEDMDCGWGMIEYTTTLPEVTEKSVLTLNDCHDFAMVYVDGKYIGKIDRVKNEKSIVLPPVKKGQVLNILVEAMGRINFGRAIKDFKGITQEVLLQAEVDGHEMTWNLKNWSIITMSDDYDAIKKAMSEGHNDMKRRETIFSDGGYFKGEFTLKKVGDTFLNFETWGKGQVWVNGHAMGRIWSIGPQQTLYIPGCWLRRSLNSTNCSWKRATNTIISATNPTSIAVPLRPKGRCKVAMVGRPFASPLPKKVVIWLSSASLPMTANPRQPSQKSTCRAPTASASHASLGPQSMPTVRTMMATTQATKSSISKKALIGRQNVLPLCPIYWLSTSAASRPSPPLNISPAQNKVLPVALKTTRYIYTKTRLIVSF